VDDPGCAAGGKRDLTDIGEIGFDDPNWTARTDDTIGAGDIVVMIEQFLHDKLTECATGTGHQNALFCDNRHEYSVAFGMNVSDSAVPWYPAFSGCEIPPNLPLVFTEDSHLSPSITCMTDAMVHGR